MQWPPVLLPRFYHEDSGQIYATVVPPSSFLSEFSSTYGSEQPGQTHRPLLFVWIEIRSLAVKRVLRLHRGQSNTLSSPSGFSSCSFAALCFASFMVRTIPAPGIFAPTDLPSSLTTGLSKILLAVPMTP